MKGIILAAGRGLRMKNQTEDRPKCLVELAGKPLLAWQLQALRAAGIDDLAVVCGWRAEMLTDYAKSPDGGFRTIKNERWAETNMVSSLLCTLSWAEDEECLISYSDIVYPAAHIGALMTADAPIAIVYDVRWEELWRLRFADPLGDAETFREENGVLMEIGAKARSPAEIHGQYMGLLKIGSTGWKAIMDLCAEPNVNADRLDMTGLLRRLLADGLKIGAVPVSGCWCEVDSESDLALYREKVKTHGAWSHDWRRS
ncbi:transferase [Alphaproteobacteria bacterium]|nr:transferase [Alphaproteobacteria bacterium]